MFFIEGAHLQGKGGFRRGECQCRWTLFSIEVQFYTEGPGGGWLTGRQADSWTVGQLDSWTGRTAPRPGTAVVLVVWCECEVNNVSLPYSQPVWTACH